MSPSAIASIVFGALGVGGGVVALYIRGTIAETIIVRLNGRYVGGKLCRERHDNLTAQLARMERQAEKIDKKVEDGFASLHFQLMRMLESEKRVESDQIKREHVVRNRLDNAELEPG